MKACTKCGESKALAEFYVNRRARDGRTTWCKDCTYYSQRSQKIDYGIAYYRANTDRARSYQEKYRREHPGYCREWRKTNRSAVAEAGRRRQARKKKATVVRFSPAQLDARMAAWGKRCWMCGGPFEHVDHVNPLAKGGPHMLANLRPACADCNIRKHAKWSGISAMPARFSPARQILRLP